MGETKNEETPYATNKGDIKETGGADYKEGKRVEDWKTATAEAVNKTPIHKLFLILSIVIYGVISYSKGNEGVSREDLSFFIFFLIITLLLSCILAFFIKIYDHWDELFENFTPFIRRNTIKIFIIVALLLIAIILLLTFKDAIFDILHSVILKIS